MKPFLSKTFHFLFILLFLASCSGKQNGQDSPTLQPTDTFVPAPTNSKVSPSLTQSATFAETTPTAISTESLLYGGFLPVQPGMVYKLESGSVPYQRLWIVDQNKEERTYIYNGENLVLSSDMHYAAFTADGDIWLLNLKSEEKINLTNSPGCSEYTVLWNTSVAWNTETTKLAYFGCPDNSKYPDLFVFDIPTKQSANITNTPDREEGLFVGWWQSNTIYFASGIPEKFVPGSPLRGQCHTNSGECRYFFSSTNTDGSSYRVIDNVSGIGFQPALSPDGKNIAFDGGIVYDLEMGEYKSINPANFGISPGVIVNPDGPELVNPAWSPDGTQMVWLGHIANTAGSETAIYLFDLETHTGNILHRYDPYYLSLTLAPWQRWTDINARWSPDGKYIATISDELIEDGGSLVLRIFDNRGYSLKSFAGVGDLNLIWSPDSNHLVFDYFEKANNSLVTIITNVNDWELHPLDIPSNSEMIDWKTFK